MNIRFGWMVRRAMPSVLEIERAAYAYPWSEAEFLDAMLQRGCIGVVARCRQEVVGFVLYKSSSRSLEIINLAVSASCRRHGIGKQLVDFLKDKLAHGRKDEITTCIADDNLPAQIFFRGQRFLATAVLKDHFEQHEGDAYVMKYRLDVRPEPQRSNRLSKVFGMEV
jgi:ribosomal-protein-alanine N-acetyltransferase